MQVPAPLKVEKCRASVTCPPNKINYGLNVPHPKIHVLTLTPPFDDIWNWGLWMISGYKGGAPHDGISALLAREMRQLTSLSAHM